MKKTDYESIANRYDRGAYRQKTDVDEELSKVLSRPAKGARRVLDVGCGTGNYLAVQGNAFSDFAVDWHGMDPSPSMLAIARSKTRAHLTRGRAEHLPFQPGTFDYVSMTLSFHHFQDKNVAVPEIVRMLNTTGVVRLFSIDPFNMPMWWVYRLFPGTMETDFERFWERSELESAFRAQGIQLTIQSSTLSRDVPLTKLCKVAENRDVSQLANLGDEEFSVNLDKMKRAAREEPDRVVHDQVAFVLCIGRRV